MELRVTYRTPMDGELRACMMKHLVKYLLFMRGQIPCLYDELLQFVENYQQQQVGGSRQRLSTNGGTKKAVKCVEAAELLFGVQLDAIFSLKVQKVALIFGSSMMSPREAVVVDFEVVSEVEDAEYLPQSTTGSPDTDQEDMSLEDSQTLTPPSPPMTREKLMRLCAQKLMRAVFTHAMEQFSSALPATKLHIAVLAERHATRIPGFLPKQQFKLRLPKDKRGVRTHYVTIYSGVNSMKQSLQKDSQQSPAEQTTSDNSISMENDSPVGSGVNSALASATASNASDMMWVVNSFSTFTSQSDYQVQFEGSGMKTSELPNMDLISPTDPVLQLMRTRGELREMQQPLSPTAFASLEERIAHLNWRKICNEREIQGTLRFTKQLQERDEFIRAAKSGNKAQRERMQLVIRDEFTKPLPVTAQFYEELTALQREDELKAQKAAERHITQLHNIQAKLDAREAQLTRKKEFERKKKELFAGN